MPARSTGRLFDEPQLKYVILASPKSGTQWMQQLLGAHPQVHCAESRAFGEYFDPTNVSSPNITLETYVSILSNYHRPPQEVEDKDAYFRQLLFNLQDTIAATSLAASGKSIYGEKITPLTGIASQIVDRLAEYNPDLRFVHLSRDGRDVAVSGLSHQTLIHSRAESEKASALSQALAETRVDPEMLEFFCFLWEDAVTAALKAKDLFKNYLHVRYEDLLEDTPGQATRLLDFLGADAGQSVVASCVEAASFEKMSGGRTRGEEKLDSVVRKGVAGDWVRWFSPDQVEWFEAKAGHLLDSLGYERAARQCS